MTSPGQSQMWTGVTALVIFIAGLWSFWGAIHPFAGDTSNSRMATVYALTEYGTWEIGNPEEPNPFESGTIDKVRVDGRMYSSKPPVMPLLMTGEFMVARALLGLDLDVDEDRVTIAKIVTVSFITFPFILSGIVLWRILRYLGVQSWVQVFGVTAFMWGTEYAGYAATINNHVPATACLIIALWGYWVVKDKQDVQTNIISLLLGIVMGLTVTIDLPAAIFVLLLIVGYVVKFSKYAVLFGIAGFLIPVAIHSVVMMSLSGSPLPFQMNHDYYIYEESYWRNPIGIDALHHSRGLYLFNMTLGSVGALTLYPVLAIGLVATLGQLYRGSEKTSRLWSFGVLCALLILGSYYVTSTNNYGGASFGFRWFVITTPFLIVPVAILLDNVKSKLVMVLCIFLLSVSIFSSTQCRIQPWSVNQEWTTKVFGELT
jgi:hypothetical protein